ncbi:MAG: hypothetical protein IJ460_01015 [Clostridia bacterium]|nr:hypothetical protein [Clostridia bacterium]
MLKVNTNVIGIGKTGVTAVNRLADGNMPEIRTAVFCVEDEEPALRAEYVLKSKYDFVEHKDKFFVTSDTAVFILADCTDCLEISLACELAFITARMGGFSVALAYMPSSVSPRYSDACEALEELHECFDGVVRFNESYCDDFDTEILRFFEVLSGSMSTEAISGLGSFGELKKLFDKQKDIYFASVASKVTYDSHAYRSKCLELRLCSQTYVDTASCLDFFYISGGPVSKNILDIYTDPIKKINIAFMNTVNTYISDNNSELENGDFVFAVMCAE